MGQYEDDLEFTEKFDQDLNVYEAEQQLIRLGLIQPPKPSLMTRVKNRLITILTLPIRILSYPLVWLYWTLYGQRAHQKRIEREIARFKKLAGVDEPSHVSVVERVGLLGINHPDHDEAIRKIVIEPLPKPDTDDTGVN